MMCALGFHALACALMCAELSAATGVGHANFMRKHNETPRYIDLILHTRYFAFRNAMVELPVSAIELAAFSS
ncbi:hypothetical protein KC19_12G075300 [Ceratodon purpureus]|uniref:Secreted protein n=1 Tax=Ceratodon purpureus TaxID=3225 RepID=A0A8T0G5W5_CERPU|nr:hypothetical protein KC19_12G075300 [Ceratodon purpureus]